MVAAPTNGTATAAGTVGIIALVLSLIPVINLISWPLSIAAIVLGAIGVPRASRLGGMGRRMAIAGLVLGMLASGIAILYIALYYNFQASCTVNGSPC
jgi:Na+/H+-dicarboxylate symporter